MMMKEKVEIKREHILSTASSLFASKSYYGTSMQDIAESVKLKKQSLYHYFSSKEDIFYELVHSALATQIENMKPILKSTLSPTEKLHHAIATHLSNFIKYRAAVLLQIYGSPIMFDAKRSNQINGLAREYEEMFRQILREGVVAGAFKAETDISLIEFAILGMLNYVDKWYSQTGRLSTEQISRIYTDFVFNGIGASKDMIK